MRAALLLSVLALCGVLAHFPGVDVPAWADETNRTMGIILIVLFALDVGEVVMK